MTKILILGATGMLGSAMLHQFHRDHSCEAFGTIRGSDALRHFPSILHDRLIRGVDVLDQDRLAQVMAKVRPDVVINCVGVIKQAEVAKDPLAVLPLNAMLPHRLAALCAIGNTRLIHISTDCVFSGAKGMYTEEDVSDAEDLYGKSKQIGEVVDQPHAVTLRTSIIGHELGSALSLVDWFLSQSGSVSGYKNAIFSGLPTVELARVIRDFVIPNSQLKGLYHVSVAPIDKFTLLGLVARQYGKAIEIIPDDRVRIDRSLDSSRFREAVGYAPPDWQSLISLMHSERQ